MSDILEWARREVEIACKKERGDSKDKGFDYGGSVLYVCTKGIREFSWRWSLWIFYRNNYEYS